MNEEDKELSDEALAELGKLVDPRALIPDICNEPDVDYILVGPSCWITVKNLSVYIRKCDEGVSISIYPHHSEMDDAIVETWALWTEGEMPDEP